MGMPEYRWLLDSVAASSDWLVSLPSPDGWHSCVAPFKLGKPLLPVQAVSYVGLSQEQEYEAENPADSVASSEVTLSR